MIKRILAFFVDNIALNFTAILLNVGGSFFVTSIQFLAIILVVYLQHQLWGKTLGMHVLGLKIFWRKSPQPMHRLLVLIPFFIYYGIRYMWAVVDHLTVGGVTYHWLEPGNREIPLPVGVLAIQTIMLFGFMVMVLAPQFLREKRMGWEILAGCEISNEFGKN